VLGTNFKIVTGYPGGNDVDLAMERGEVADRCGCNKRRRPRPLQRATNA